MGSLLRPGKRAPNRPGDPESSSGLTSRRSRPHRGGDGIKPALQSSLVLTARQRRGHGSLTTLGMICTKSRHKSLAQAGSAWGLPARQPPPRAQGAAALGQGRSPLAGLHGALAEGPGRLQGARHRERWPTHNPGLLPREASFFPSMSRQRADHRPVPLQGLPQGNSSCSFSPPLAHTFGRGQWHLWCGFRPAPHRAAGETSRRGNGEGAGLGVGAQRTQTWGTADSLCSAANSLTGGAAPSRVPEAWSPAAIETNRRGHGRAHALAHTHPTSHSDLVLNTQRV